MYLTGTIRTNRHIPNLLKNVTMERGETVFAKQGRVLGCAYRPENGKKPVRLILSHYSVKTTRNGKPSIICRYKKFRGVVDISDMMLQCYDDQRKASRYGRRWLPIYSTCFF